MVQSPVIQRRMRFIHPVLPGAAVVLCFIRIFGEKILGTYLVPWNPRPDGLRPLEDFRVSKNPGFDFCFTHQPAEHVHHAGRYPLSAFIPADHQRMAPGRCNAGPAGNGLSSCGFSVQIQGHRPGFPVHHGTQVVPDTAFQSSVFPFEKKEPLSVSDQKAQFPESLVSHQKSPMSLGIDLAQNS